MRRGRLGIARADRRDAFVAFAVLLGILVSHSMLETARDALFLASLPPSRLPLVYLMIAGLALCVVWVNDKALERFRDLRLLQATLVLAAAVTIGFWLLADRGGDAMLYALYVWTGLVATVSVAQFWILLADRFNVGSAKRTYAFIAAGGLVGATAGSAAAGGLLEITGPEQLLLASPVVLLATALVAGALSPGDGPSPPRRGRHAGIRDSLSELLDHPYLRRVLLLVVLTTVTVTAVDLTFKTVVAESVAPADLGSFFALFYAALNGVALVVQLVLASRIIAAVGVNRTLLILPLLLLASAAGYLVTGAALAVLLLKGFDGTLRHSLNRTGSEVLYLPVPPGLRARGKVFIDGVGARGGQALAAIGILGAMSIGAQPWHMAIAVGGAAALWLLVVVGLQRHYLELFRQQLRAGSIETRMEVPELDLHSLETLLAALNSDDEKMVRNALDLLDHSGRARLIPALILYHPSREVIERALEIFVAAERTDFVPVARRLLSSVDPELRAAALRAVIAVAPSEELLRDATRDSSPVVKSTAIVGLAAAGLCSDDEFRDAVLEITGSDRPDRRLALARAIPAPDGGQLDWALARLGEVDEPALRAEVAQTIAHAPSEPFLPLLLSMLASRAARPPARTALVRIGEPALAYLSEPLFDPAVDPRIKLHIPRTISRFGGIDAANQLLDYIASDPDSQVAYKCLRGLGRMVADDPELSIDRAQIRSVAQAAVQRALTMLAWRMNLERGARADAVRKTQGSELLIELLSEKEKNTIERIFRLFGLLHPEEDFARIYHGLFAGDKSRASSRELIENIIDEPVRSAVLALSDTGTDSLRLLEADGFFKPLFYSYEEQLAVMLADDSEAIRILAAHHVGELGLGDLEKELRAAQSDQHGAIAEVVSRALQILGLATREPSPHAP